MCGGAILAELIPPSAAGRAPKQVAAGQASSKKGGMSKRHHISIPDVDDFEAAFEDFDDDFDLQAEEDGGDHVVFASKPAFYPGRVTLIVHRVCNHEIMFIDVSSWVRPSRT